MRKYWETLCRIFNAIELNFMVFFTLIMGAFIIVEVCIRSLGFQGIPWVEEMGRMMLVTTTLVGSSMAVKSNGHAVMDVLYNMVSAKVAYVLRIIVHLFCGIAYFFMGIFAFQWTKQLFSIGKTMDSVRFPVYPFWIIITIAFVTMGFRYLAQIRTFISRIRSGAEYSEINLKEM